MKVRFSKNGFYHPAFGRMGLGKNAGDIYDLPEIFRASGMLPSSAEILDDKPAEDVEELLERQGQKRPHKPKVVDESQFEKAKEMAAKRSAPRGSGKKALAS